MNKKYTKIPNKFPAIQLYAISQEILINLLLTNFNNNRTVLLYFISLSSAHSYPAADDDGLLMLYRCASPSIHVRTYIHKPTVKL